MSGDKIKQFKDEYRWLSNFYELEMPLIYDGISFATTEHFYQAMKASDRKDMLMISKHPLKGLKKMMRTYPVRSGFHDEKIAIMLYAQRNKFSKNNPTLRKLLIDTGDCEIEEGNWWGDTFWGVDIETGEGQNCLGNIIMRVRDEINGWHLG